MALKDVLVSADHYQGMTESGSARPIYCSEGTSSCLPPLGLQDIFYTYAIL
jgi:hypothetical protein